MTFVRYGETGFIQEGSAGMVLGPQVEPCSGERDGLSSRNSRGKQESVAKQQVGVSGRKITEREHQESGELWLNRPNRIRVDCRPGCSDLTQG